MRRSRMLGGCSRHSLTSCRLSASCRFLAACRLPAASTACHPSACRRLLRTTHRLVTACRPRRRPPATTRRFLTAGTYLMRLFARCCQRAGSNARRTRPAARTPEGAVRPAMVVVLAPVVDDAAHVAQAGKPLLRQALVAEAAVEALDVCVLHGLTGLDLLPPGDLPPPPLDAVATEMDDGPPLDTCQHRRRC